MDDLIVYVLTYKEVDPCHDCPAMSCPDNPSMLFKEAITAATSLLPMKTMDVFVITCRKPVNATVVIYMPMF